MRVYLATHFFDQAGFEFTEKLARKIRENCPNIDLYVPQENSDINDKENNDGNITAKAIYRGDTDRLLFADILVAYIDGVEIDSGVAGEIGAMAMRNELNDSCKIIGLYTDMRRHGTGDNHMYKNLFVKGAIEEHGALVHTINDVVKEINKYREESNE